MGVDIVSSAREAPGSTTAESGTSALARCAATKLARSLLLLVATAATAAVTVASRLASASTAAFVSCTAAPNVTAVSPTVAAAKARFRGLPLSYLSVEDMQSNKPSPELFGKTEIQELGEAECFVSHSWSDPGEPKYAALQEWKAPFIEKEVDPVLWLDKACIDQGDIDANLASLPIFLSGCKSMMCLIGRTYTSRLW